MTAIRRPNTVTEEERPIEVDSREAVLGINVGIGVLWFARAIVFPQSSKANLGIPDARNNELVCIAAICPVQCNKVIWHYKPKKPPRRDGLLGSGIGRGLFGGLLPRRVERAGSVNFRDLVVAETQDLAQDFVGVLAKQG